MILAIHQPQFMPWLGYFDKIIKSEIFCFLDNVQFKKNEFQNRNKIKTRQGWMWLTVPVMYHYPEKINEVKVNNDIPWRKKHLKTLMTYYQKAPHFSNVFPHLENFYNKEEEYISLINVRSVLMLMGLLGVSRETPLASELGPLPEEPSERLAAICALLGADTYLSGAGGREYLNPEPFQRRGIKVIFQDFQHPHYPQLYGGFIANLSLLDLLFNCGPQSRKILEGSG